MRSLSPCSLLAVLAGLVAAVAASCSRPDEASWPTRNYSGVYAVQSRLESSSTCLAPSFAPGDTLRFTLIQYPDNRTRMDIPPVVSIPGSFREDRLEGYVAVAGVPGLRATGDADPARPSADDSGAGPGSTGGGAIGVDRAEADSLRYRLTLDFEGTGFRGRYQVEQPPIGEGVEACTQEFEVEGTEVSAD